MGRLILRASTLTVFVMLACGGSTTGMTGSAAPNGSGGSSGERGAPECTKGSDCGYPLICLHCPDGIDSCPTGANCVGGRCVTTYSHECSLSSGGSTGLGGSGGVSTGGTAGGVSPGKATIEFTVTGPNSYCMTMQCLAGTVPSIDIKDASGHSLFNITASCSDVSCSTCQPSPCPGYYCPPPSGVVVTGSKLEWDGSHTVASTCGAGTSCIETVYAPPGRYTAEMCATPGKLTGLDGGVQQCVTTGPAKCSSVDFDFPSSTVVRGTVGP